MVAMMMVATSALSAIPQAPNGLNGIWGNRAAIFVGKFNDTSDCVAAARAWGYPTGDRLYSWTHHLPNFPSPDYESKCFGLADHTWKPVPDASQPPIITSERILWDEPACGGAAAPTTSSLTTAGLNPAFTPTESGRSGHLTLRRVKLFYD